MDQELEPQLNEQPTTPPDVEVSPDLLESPIDYPIDNQAEMVALVEEPAPQTVDVIEGTASLDTLQDELLVAVEGINDLLDLHATIKAKGVSSHDMSGLKAIQKRMLDNNIALPQTGLEEFEGFYTPERSLLNQRPSLENIGKVIIETVKAWIRKLIEIVMQGYRWVKGLKQKHVVLDAQLVKARDVLIEVRKIYIKMKTLNGVMGAEAAKTLNELSESALIASKLDRNRVTLYGFSQETATKSVKALYTEALSTAEATAGRVNVLAMLLDSKEIPSDDASDAARDLAAVAQTVDELTVFSDDDEFLLKELGADFWDKVEGFRKVQVIDFDQLVKHYGSAADALGRIRSIKLEDEHQAERAQVVIDSITKAVDHLNKIVGFFNRAAQAQIAAAKTYREYYSSAIEILMLDFKSKNPASQTVKEMKNLIAELQKLK
jgi:hypothetical protein